MPASKPKNKAHEESEYRQKEHEGTKRDEGSSRNLTCKVSEGSKFDDSIGTETLKPR